MKKTVMLVFVLLSVLVFCASCAGNEKLTVNVAALNGPTGMGMAYLTEQNEQKKTENDYNIIYEGAPDSVSGALISGALDMAAVPVNLAAGLYNKTQGNVLTIAVNTLGTLYIVDVSGTIASAADLEGKTIAIAGKGSMPEYIMDFVLEQNGLMDKVNIEYLSEHAECVTKLASGDADCALLPEPFVTTALSKVEGARVAVDLTKEWETTSGKQLVMGVVVVRKLFAKEHPGLVRTFLKEYKTSVEYALNDPKSASGLIEKYGILQSAAIAEKALPNCNICYYDGDEMQDMVSEMLAVLYNENPKLIGEVLPGEDMFFK